MPQASPRRLASDIRWGVVWGSILALALTLVLLVLFAVHGSKLFDSYGTSFTTVALLYLCGGVAGGVIVGLLRPLSRWRIGAVVMGVFAAVPIGIGIRLMRSGLEPWGATDSIGLGIFALALGGTVGWIYWGLFRNP
jgi:hypothetical protein